MTEGYFDDSMTRTANRIQWNRGLDGPIPKEDRSTRAFIDKLANPVPGYALVYSPYALYG